MSLSIKQVGTSLQVEDASGHWLLFTLDELRSHATLVPSSRVEGAPALPEGEADLLAWSAFAAARGYAVEHGLIAGN